LGIGLYFFYTRILLYLRALFSLVGEGGLVEDVADELDPDVVFRGVVSGLGVLNDDDGAVLSWGSGNTCVSLISDWALEGGRFSLMSLYPDRYTDLCS